LEIAFDQDKDKRNRRKYGLSLGDAERFGWDSARIEEDTRFDNPEQCFEATGLMGDTVCVVIYCHRGDTTRIISLRQAQKHEIKRYVH